MSKDTRLVYSTDPDWKKKYCPACGNLLEECICTDRQKKNNKPSVIYIERQKKGRGGKEVTVIFGLTSDLKEWKKEFQKLCATGGTVKNDTIEIQGDHRNKIKNFLSQKGFSVKLRGG